MFYTDDLISELSGHSAHDCVSHSDLNYTYAAQRDIFCLNRDLMKGLVLMTDNSCNKFRFVVEDNLFPHQILNDRTSL